MISMTKEKSMKQQCAGCATFLSHKHTHPKAEEEDRQQQKRKENISEDD